jgi:vacuolar-type H+-ATPase subunit E/Vma4
MKKPTQAQLEELKRLSREARTSDWSEVVQSKEEAETRIRDLKESADGMRGPHATR